MARQWIAPANGAAEERLSPEERLLADVAGECTLQESLRLLGIEGTGRMVGHLGLQEARRQLGLPLRQYRRLAELAGALVVLEASRGEPLVELVASVCCSIASIAARP